MASRPPYLKASQRRVLRITHLKPIPSFPLPPPLSFQLILSGRHFLTPDLLDYLIFLAMVTVFGIVYLRSMPPSRRRCHKLGNGSLRPFADKSFLLLILGLAVRVPLSPGQGRATLYKAFAAVLNLVSFYFPLYQSLHT